MIVRFMYLDWFVIHFVWHNQDFPTRFISLYVLLDEAQNMATDTMVSSTKMVNISCNIHNSASISLFSK